MKIFFRNHTQSLRVVFLVGILLDQVTKSSADRVIINEGVSFGWQLYGLEEAVAILLIMMSFLIWWKVKTSVLQDWGLVLIMAGAVSNLIDRLIFGGVRDWLRLPFLSVSNNLADILLVLGVGGIIASLIYEKRTNNHL